MKPQLEDYEVLDIIGQGAYGTVKKVQRKSDKKKFVWKELHYGEMEETERQDLVLEVNILRTLNHPNIVKFNNYIVDKAKCILYIIMEYCSGGDLKQLIKKCKQESSFIEEKFIWNVLLQVSKALQVCHEKSEKLILHRDIKPANIFLTDDAEVKLGDFGLAKILSSTRNFATTFVGTPNYMSPEVICGKEYNEMSDMWSLGCLIYEMCTLHPPFIASTQKELVEKIKEERIQRIPCQYSDELWEVIDLLLIREAYLRPTAFMVLNHTAVTKNTSIKDDEFSSIKEKEFSAKNSEKKCVKKLIKSYEDFNGYESRNDKQIDSMPEQNLCEQQSSSQAYEEVGSDKLFLSFKTLYKDLSNVEKNLNDREMKIQSKDKQLKAKEIALLELQSNLEEKSAEILKSEIRLISKNKELMHRDFELEDKHFNLKLLKIYLDKRESNIVKREKNIVCKNRLTKSYPLCSENNNSNGSPGEHLESASKLQCSNSCEDILCNDITFEENVDKTSEENNLSSKIDSLNKIHQRDAEWFDTVRLDVITSIPDVNSLDGLSPNFNKDKKVNIETENNLGMIEITNLEHDKKVNSKSKPDNNSKLKSNSKIPVFHDRKTGIQPPLDKENVHHKLKTKSKFTVKKNLFKTKNIYL